MPTLDDAGCIDESAIAFRVAILTWATVHQTFAQISKRSAFNRGLDGDFTGF
jgi:hypothetical protein